MLALLASFATAPAMSEDGFVSLFNGRDLSGWHGNNPHTTAKIKDRAEAIAAQQVAFKAHWRVENGELVNDGWGPHATTDQEYGDFELRLEYKSVAQAESGVYLRGTPQIQLHADKALGQWNRLRVVLVGSRTWVWRNGELVVDGAIYHNAWTKGATPLPKTGPIHLQTYGGKTRWRDVEIREIRPDEANQILMERADQGYEPMLKGNHFEGWQGATNAYAIDDGVIHTGAGGGKGHLFTEKKYADFVWRLEFKLAPAANNGLAIRYAGTGNPAYKGMCELQVLDDRADRYANLDPRQYHGSIYGMVAAHRGYQRPLGEWNFQEVRVLGSRITVELNGSIILDADQAKVTETMKPGRKPNKIPKDGFLGFCGHGPGIAYRNLQISEQ